MKIHTHEQHTQTTNTTHTHKRQSKQNQVMFNKTSHITNNTTQKASHPKRHTKQSRHTKQNTNIRTHQLQACRI